jgi:hypothetical protein
MSMNKESYELGITKSLNDLVRNSNFKIHLYDTVPDTPITLTSELRSIIVQGVDRGIIDTKDAIVTFISYIETQDYFVLMGYLIRNTPEINFYVQTDRNGNVHILVYIFLKLYEIDRQRCLKLLTMMVLKGANANFSAIEKTAETCYLWLSTRGFGDLYVLDKKSINSLSFESSLNIYILLDEYDILADYMEISVDSLELCIKAYSNKSFKLFVLKLIKEENDKLRLNRVFQNLMKDCVFYLNSEAFDILITQGTTINHNMITHLSMRRDTYERTLLSIPEHIIIEMMKRIATSGIDINIKLPVEVENVYKNTPKWSKYCSIHNGIVEPYLKSLSKLLKINYNSKSDLCNQLYTLSKIDRNVLKEAYIRRRQTELKYKLHGIEDFVDNIKDIKLSNEEIFQGVGKDPMLINENNIVIYKDPKFSTKDNPKYWGIPRKLFKEFYITKQNIYAAEPDNLPLHVLREIHLKMLHHKGVDFDQVLDVIYGKDNLDSYLLQNI